MKCLELDRQVQAVAAEKVGDTEQPHPLSPLHTSEAETHGIRSHNKRRGEVTVWITESFIKHFEGESKQSHTTEV